MRFGSSIVVNNYDGRADGGGTIDVKPAPVFLRGAYWLSKGNVSIIEISMAQLGVLAPPPQQGGAIAAASHRHKGGRFGEGFRLRWSAILVGVAEEVLLHPARFFGCVAGRAEGRQAQLHVQDVAQIEFCFPFGVVGCLSAQDGVSLSYFVKAEATAQVGVARRSRRVKDAYREAGRTGSVQVSLQCVAQFQAHAIVG